MMLQEASEEQKPLKIRLILRRMHHFQHWKIVVEPITGQMLLKDVDREGMKTWYGLGFSEYKHDKRCDRNE